MNPPQRTVAFLCAMFLTFGISGLDLENPEWANNTLHYVTIVIGVILLVAFVVMKIRK